MSKIYNAAPGQLITIVFEQLITDGYRSDGYDAIDFGAPDGYGVDGYYNLPLVNRIIFPSLSLASGYPQKMARIDTGLYYFTFTLPTGASAVGTYIVDIEYVNPNTEGPAETFAQVVVTAPYGNYNITTY